MGAAGRDPGRSLHRCRGFCAPQLVALGESDIHYDYVVGVRWKTALAGVLLACVLVGPEASGGVAPAIGRPLWPGDVAVDTNSADQGLGRIAPPGIAAVADGEGGAIFFWTDEATGRMRAQRLDENGSAQWGAGGIVVAPVATYQSIPRAIPDGHGGAIVGWVDDRNGSCGPTFFAECGVIVQRIDASGQRMWPASGIEVGSTGPAQGVGGFRNQGTRGIGLSSDGDGGAIVGWEEAGGSSFAVYAQRVDETGAVLWSPAAVQISSNHGGSDVPPAVVGDGDGGGLIGWFDGQAEELDGGPGIKFQRLNADGELQLPSATVVALDVAGPHRVVDDLAGGAIVVAVVTSLGSDPFPDIGAQRIDSAGVNSWGSEAIPVAVAPYFQQQLVAVADGAGGALIAWADLRTFDVFNPDIYAQRIDANGTPLWTQNGIAITSGIPGQALPTITGDGSGGAIVVWKHCRSLIRPPFQVSCVLEGEDLYAQRISAAGVPLWPANGVALTTGPFGQGVDYGSVNVPSVALVSDAARGAIVAWPDGRSGSCSGSGLGNCDVYAQRISDQFGAGPDADLAVTMTSTPVPPLAGGQVTSSIVVTNLGPDPAQSVQLANFIAPIGVVAVLTADQGECAGEALCSLGRLDAGDSATVTYSVSASQVGTIEQLVQVYAAENDPDPSNNEVSEVRDIVADFVLQAAPFSQAVTSGEVAIFLITATAVAGAVFAEPPDFACTALPVNTTCTVAARISSDDVDSVTLTIQTGVEVGTTISSASLGLLAVLVPFGIATHRRSSRLRLPPAHYATVVLAAVILLASCSGGGGGENPEFVTPVGNHTIEVTVTNGAVSHVASVLLTVN